MADHVDDTGAPCTRHPPVALGRVFELAVVGSRVPGFHHDCASKLQSLMMALDEIGELAGHGDPELRVATNTANTALRDLHALLTANRALAKPPQRTRVALGEILLAAGMRVGVRVDAAIPMEVEVAVPAMTHAFGMLLDLVAGPIQLGRTVESSARVVDREVVLELAGPAEALEPAPATANEVIAIATFVIERDGGRLCCRAEGNAIEARLPLR